MMQVEDTTTAHDRTHGVGERSRSECRLALDDAPANRRHAAPGCASDMNIVFRTPSAELDARFITRAEQAGLVGTEGHRTLGGLRVSLYDGVTVEDARVMAAFLQEFAHEHRDRGAAAAPHAGWKGVTSVDEICFEGPVGINEADLLETGARDGFAHNLLLVHELHGALDVERLAAALRWLGERHESLRTSFVRTESGWRRRVHARARAELEVIDVSAEPDAEAAARAKVLAFGHTPFDRAVPPLIRPKLVQLAAGRFWWVSCGDHVVLDGTAFASGLAELLAAYVELGEGRAPSLPPPVQPRAYFAALEEILRPLREAPGPWSAPDPPDGFPLRPDPSRPGGPDPAGARHVLALGDADAVDAFARANGVSRSAPLLAAMALGLRELAARPDVAFTLIRSGRRDPAWSRVVGCLAWGDSFAVRIDADEPLAAVLARAEAFLRDASPWRMLYIPRVEPASRRLVLNVNRYRSAFELPGFVAFPRPDLVTEVRMWSTHDLLVQVVPLPGVLHGVVRYRTSMFEPATMARFGESMQRALGALVANPSAPVRAID